MDYSYNLCVAMVVIVTMVTKILAIRLFTVWLLWRCVIWCACISVQLGKVDDAIKDCSRALELDPEYMRALQRRAKL